MIKGDSEEILKKRKSEILKQYINAIGEAGIALELPIEGKIDFICNKFILAKNITGVSVINFYP